jgi:hypothetical protein
MDKTRQYASWKIKLGASEFICSPSFLTDKQRFVNGFLGLFYFVLLERNWICPMSIYGGLGLCNLSDYSLHLSSKK